MPESVAVRLSGVDFRYPGRSRPALEGVSLDVREGTFTALLGPNGAGKSTVVRLVAGTLRPSAGEVLVHDRAPSAWKRSELARRLAVVSQEAPPGGIPLTVQDYVELGRNPYVGPWARLGRSDEAIVAAALERTDLGGLRRRELAALSGGERQRAKLARALAQCPRLLLLDEPTVHLDLRHALWVFAALRRLVDEEGVTVLCVTHDLHLASRFADRAALLGGGRLLGEGRPEDVLRPSPLTEAFECDLRVRPAGELGLVVLPVGTRRAAEGRA